MTGLQKQILEIPLVAGLSQQIAPEVAPVGALYDLTNVEIDRIGNMARRYGFEFLSSAAFNLGTSSASSTIGTPKKIGNRVDELWIITGDSYYLGSGGGGGSAGDMLWTYSPELQAWKPHTHVPRTTVERWSGLQNSDISPQHAAVGYVSFQGVDLIVVAYCVLDNTASNDGVHVVVFDATSRAVILEDQLLSTDCAEVRVVSIGATVMVIWQKEGAAPALQWSKFSASNPSAGFSAAASLLASANDGAYWAVGTDGTSLFVLYDKFGTGNTTLEKFNTSGATQGTLLIDATGHSARAHWSIYYAAGRLFLGYGANFVKFASVTTTLTGLLGPIQVSSFGNADSVTIAAIDGTTAMLFYTRSVQTLSPPIGEPPTFWWRQVNFASSAPSVGAVEHESINFLTQGDAFAFGGRFFVPVTGCDIENGFRVSSGPGAYTGYGHALVEFSTDTAAGSAYGTGLPVAQWARDASRANGTSNFGTSLTFLVSSGAFGNDSDRYLASLRLVRLVDRFGGGARDPGGGSTATPVTDSTSAYGIDIMRAALDDKKRWQHAELGGCAIIAAGLPYAYDGLLAHESGFLFRPEILGTLVTASGGNFTAGDLPTYKVVFDWEDLHGDRWFSDSSYPVQATIASTGSKVDLRVRAPVLSAKPLGGSYFSGRIRVSLFRSDFASSEDFRKIGEKFSDTFTTTNVVFSDDGSSFLASERAYIVGGELDNACAPPCRSLVQHGARLFAISTDDGKLWFTKEKRFGRGIEWSAYQTITLPHRGMALASVEGALLVFCEQSIYVLEGQGPDAIGQPPDGYSRLSLLSHDKGCSEINAAWRTPAGTLFRGYQGIWMVDGTLGVSFVGAPVEDFTDTVSRFVDAALDTAQARLRIMCLLNTGDYRILNYWYDSNRWSIDTIDESEGAQYSTTVHQGVYHRAFEEGVYFKSSTRFFDGNTVPVYKASVQTGWLRMGAMAEFKRVWRALATVGKIRAELNLPLFDLLVTVENENGICAQRLYKSSLFPPLGDWSIRMHLWKQKGKAFRIRVEEVENENTHTFTTEGEVSIALPGPPGYTFSCLGLEYGVKRGAAKLPAGRTK